MTDEDRMPPAPIEYRDANVAGVNFAQRLIEIIAVPYGETAVVEYRGEIWKESFERGAFDGIEKRPNRVRANRDHDRKRIVGKVLNFFPSRQEGLVAEVRIAKSSLGDETLALADEDCISASVEFAVRGSDQTLNKATRERSIRRAFIDMLGFVGDPAYAGAAVLGVRENVQQQNAATLPQLETPYLDELVAWQRGRLQSGVKT